MNINPVTTQTKQNYGRRQVIRDSGYTAVGAGTLCGITGFRQVKIPHKMKIHKYSAYIAAAATLLHWGSAKRWDKKLLNSFQTNG